MPSGLTGRVAAASPAVHNSAPVVPTPSRPTSILHVPDSSGSGNRADRFPSPAPALPAEPDERTYRLARCPLSHNNRRKNCSVLIFAQHPLSLRRRFCNLLALAFFTLFRLFISLLRGSLPMRRQFVVDFHMKAGGWPLDKCFS